MSPSDDEPPSLTELREQVRATEAAARRLASEGGPSQDWTRADGEERTEELRALVALVESLRALVPAELRDQVTEVLRQVLLLLRAVIDWLVQRVEESRAEPLAPRDRPIEDIPLD